MIKRAYLLSVVVALLSAACFPESATSEQPGANQEAPRSSTELPSTNGVFYRDGENYVEIPEQVGKGVSLVRLVSGRPMRKFNVPVTIPGRTSKFLINEKSPRLLLHLRDKEIEKVEMIRVLRIGANQRVLFHVEGYSGKVPVLSFVGRKPIAVSKQERGQGYVEIRPTNQLLAGEYAVVDDNPDSPRVWAFTLQRSAGATK
jgi:hypothetical protein